VQAYLLAGLGLLILLLAGDALVRGAVNLSLRLGVPALIVSLTIVAFGTSAPELLISVSAVIGNAPGIALGNVVGSNIANVLLVLGIPALIAGLHTSECDTRKSYLTMLAVSVLFIAVCFFGPIGWPHGIVLLAVLALILWDQARDAIAHRNGAASEPAIGIEDLEGADPEMPGWKIIVFLLLGLVGLPIGADILVDNSIVIARRFGISETVIGLTLIAVGTSLPELATTVMAAFRKQADVALGNVIGSNIFNLLAIIGITALIGRVPVDPVFLRFDLWVMLAAALLLIPFVFSKARNMTKRWGILFSLLYGIYIWIVVVNGSVA
jgi:cation:H+ antiporter